MNIGWEVFLSYVAAMAAKISRKRRQATKKQPALSKYRLLANSTHSILKTALTLLRVGIDC